MDCSSHRGLGEETKERFGGFRQQLGLCHLELMGIELRKKSLGQLAWLECCPVHQKGAGSIPSQALT